jgi:hypothetical protein
MVLFGLRVTRSPKTKGVDGVLRGFTNSLMASLEALDRVDTKDKRELRGAILAVALHFLLYPSSATANDITPLRAFLVCTCVVRHRYHTELSISGRGNDISPCAAGLLNAATMLSAFYVMEPSVVRNTQAYP